MNIRHIRRCHRYPRQDFGLLSSRVAIRAFEALRHGREWFLKPAWPPYALWWVEWDHTPTWTEAVVRHEFLHDHNASPFAFDFKTPFDEDGRSTTIDRDVVKRNIRLNEERLQQLT